MSLSKKEMFELVGMHIGDGCISKTKKYEEYALCGDLKEERDYYDSYISPLINKNVFKPILNKEILPKNIPQQAYMVSMYLIKR